MQLAMDTAFSKQGQQRIGPVHLIDNEKDLPVQLWLIMKSACLSNYGWQWKGTACPTVVDNE